VAEPKALTYRQARRITAAVGFAALSLVASVQFARGLDRIEVAGLALYLPVFAAALLGGLRTGFLAGVAAAATYWALRLPAIGQVGYGPFAGTIATRTLGFLAFGAIAGLAAGWLGAAVRKLELHDDIDDETGLANASRFLEALSEQEAREMRYGEGFAVVLATIPAGGVGEMLATAKGRAAWLWRTGRAVRQMVRPMDLAAHAVMSGKVDVLGFLLPQTGEEGAEIFRGRLEEQWAVKARVASPYEARGVFTNAAALERAEEPAS
jgi:hypothetical protein